MIEQKYFNEVSTMLAFYKIAETTPIGSGSVMKLLAGLMHERDELKKKNDRLSANVINGQLSEALVRSIADEMYAELLAKNEEIAEKDTEIASLRKEIAALDKPVEFTLKLDGSSLVEAVRSEVEKLGNWIDPVGFIMTNIEDMHLHRLSASLDVGHSRSVLKDILDDIFDTIGD